MQIPHGLLPWAILALSLSICFSATPISAAYTNTSTKSVSDCVPGSSLQVEYFQVEFWIEVVFLKPIDEIEFLKKVDDPDKPFVPAFRPDYPLRIESDYSPFEGARFNRPIISRELEVRTLFELSRTEISYDLYDSNQNFADIWSDFISNWTYSGFNAIAFNAKDRSTLSLEWLIEKVCDSERGSELRLQVFDVDKGTLSSLLDPPFHVIFVEEYQIFT